MAAHLVQLVGRAQSIEQDLYKLADSDVPSAKLIVLLQEYRAACETIIFADFKYASDNGIESHLWNAHLKINGNFRRDLRHLRRHAKEHIVEYRKGLKQYLQFIKASQKFYRQYILSLDAHVGGIDELQKSAHKWKDDSSKPAAIHRIPASLKSDVLLSCNQALIQLGDLSRYRETELSEKDKERNWGPAKGYYETAVDIYPYSGHPHNQLAVIAREDGDHFRSTYYLYRSLATKEPHPQAKKNLELELKKIATAWDKGELISNQKSSDGTTANKALISWFIRLHSKCYKGQEFAEHDELENEVLSQLALQLKERPLDAILQKIILINLSAEHFSISQMSCEKPPENIMGTYCFFLRLNVKSFFTLLQILQPELERISEGDDVTQNGTNTAHFSDRITAVARRVLPGLRLYSKWFIRYWHVLNANIASNLSAVEVQELWKAYAATLSLLASSFPVAQFPEDNYMLEEDVETIGFQPLRSKDTMKLWYDSTGNLKQKWSDLERSHPNVEMLMRIRDLLMDGVELVQKPDAPLDLDGLRYIYREAGLPSELLASPNNRPEGSPVMPAESMDFPLFPQEVPIPDDQQSYSVAAASESASTTLAKDSAMNQMVDDLVGPDEGLDPLPEEDENIPPTPPEQTFDDTTMVTDHSYGPASFNINDIVNHVYKSHRTSPAPVTPLYATPMNRVASSSSIRQPAELPSLPDGHHNGTSIWNRKYNGTPGPSSPLLGNGSDVRGSPLNGIRRSSGHARGDSSNSLRSNDWSVMSTATPVQRPFSGGLGIGAAWGNTSAPVHGSIYGNDYNYQQAGYTTDLNLMSPLMFGPASRSSNVERLHSSYGRTPPNGQGG